MIKDKIIKAANMQDLTYEEAYSVMDEIMSGEATHVQTSAYLTALSMKGETIEEITASASAMRHRAEKFEHDQDALEIVGTGGDGSNSFNISTTSAIIAAAGGVNVIKHGNRAASSKSGAADCLEALGIRIDLSAQSGNSLLEENGFCFIFAQKYHPAMKFVAPVRSQIGIRTIFNLLGPLTNPAMPGKQLLGVYSKKLVRPMAEVLSNLGVVRGMSVFGNDGIDEISISAPTTVCEFNEGVFKEYEISPEDYGYKFGKKGDIRGGSPEENAQITKDIFCGNEQGAKKQAVCMNAGAALYISGKALTLEKGVRLAEKIIDSGAAMAELKKLVERSEQLADCEN